MRSVRQATPVHYDLLEALCSHSQRVALVRLDGQYGDTVAMAQLLEAGMYFVTRARGYHVLEHPQIQGVLAHPPTASVTRVNSDEVVELFDGGWLQLDVGLFQTRVIVARHPLPVPGKRVSVRKCGGRVGLRTLHHHLAQRWIPGRGGARSLPWARSRRSRLMKMSKEDPDRWCSYTECGQESWQIACQWVWNLRLTLGKTMQGGKTREIEWAPAKPAPPFLVPEESVSQEYEPGPQAAAFGRAAGLLASRCLRFTRRRNATLESSSQPLAE
jgi:hypothetical protein